MDRQIFSTHFGHQKVFYLVYQSSKSTVRLVSKGSDNIGDLPKNKQHLKGIKLVKSSPLRLGAGCELFEGYWEMKVKHLAFDMQANQNLLAYIRLALFHFRSR
jgi:hypothetical protein